MLVFLGDKWLSRLRLRNVVALRTVRRLVATVATAIILDTVRRIVARGSAQGQVDEGGASPRPADARRTLPQEVAPDVFRLSVYGTNVFFARSAASWVLIDTGWAWGNCGRTIRQAAEALFGPNARPAAILLTHIHPDHDGAALELARVWDCPVYVHPQELPLTTSDLAGLERFANPLDRWLILPLLRALPPQWVESMRAKASLKDVARALDPDGTLPGLPEWTCVPTPGHTPGHISLFRERDRVLIAGDAVLTDDAGSLAGLLKMGLRLGQPHAFRPPRYTNWNQRATDASIGVLAALKPRVLATSHGAPIVAAGRQHPTARPRRAGYRSRRRSNGTPLLIITRRLWMR